MALPTGGAVMNASNLLSVLPDMIGIARYMRPRGGRGGNQTGRGQIPTCRPVCTGPKNDPLRRPVKRPSPWLHPGGPVHITC